MKMSTRMKTGFGAVFLIACTFFFAGQGPAQTRLTYPIVDTAVEAFYSSEARIEKPGVSDPFWGQDAQFNINPPAYIDNNDGTVTDLVTGLMWQKSMTGKMSWEQAGQHALKLDLAGYTDWRVPTVKELYSLIRFTGRVQGQQAVQLFIDTDYFDHPLGGRGDRQIDAQTWSATPYAGRTMRDDPTVFGVNFVDGRIKGYPRYHPRTGQPNMMYFRFVRGNSDYGQNRFRDNKDGTVTDMATGLMWQKADSRQGMDWENALKYAKHLTLAGYKDWRLPNAKELQSIVDYSRCPQTHKTAAIDPVFYTSAVKDPAGRTDFPYFWTSTTHQDGRNPYRSAVYIAFGSALGRMHNRLMDVHGAGAQRSDPKAGARSDYPQYFGPQGDMRVVFNYVRCVRTRDN